MKIKTASAILFLILSGAAFGAAFKELPFSQDDFQEALLQARQRNLPIFVEVWAPW